MVTPRKNELISVTPLSQDTRSMAKSNQTTFSSTQRPSKSNSPLTLICRMCCSYNDKLINVWNMLTGEHSVTCFYEEVKVLKMTVIIYSTRYRVSIALTSNNLFCSFILVFRLISICMFSMSICCTWPKSRSPTHAWSPTPSLWSRSHN